MKELRISDNKRFIVDEDGNPFFYLADTAWELFHRFDRDDADLLLRNRAERGFNVVMGVVLAEIDGLGTPNPYGATPLIDNSPLQPNEAYFEHVDWIIDRANDLGIYIGLLPTWGDKWNRKWGVGPEVFTPANARAYCRNLAERYRNRGVIWILGGDRDVETDQHRAIIEAMAAGIREVVGNSQLIAFHPQGGRGSSEYFHESDWLDFNMWQTGHARNRDNFRLIGSDYDRTPTKPTIDAEPGYEDHPDQFNIDNGYLDDYDVRKAAYWAVFAGAFGHTYGCHDIWQAWQPGRPPITFARRPWIEAIDLPGAAQMRHLRLLIESRPFLSRIPDQSLILHIESTSEATSTARHVAATRDESGSYALIYCPTPDSVTVDLSQMSASSVRISWYDPRHGRSIQADVLPCAGKHTFQPPIELGGPDWVLVIDDASAHYALPGN